MAFGRVLLFAQPHIAIRTTFSHMTTLPAPKLTTSRIQTVTFLSFLAPQQSILAIIVMADAGDTDDLLGHTKLPVSATYDSF